MLLKLAIVVLIPIALVWSAYYWRDWLDEKIPWFKGWRTVIVNAVPAAMIVLTDIVGYLAGFSWSSIFSAETAAMVALSFNIANIALRFTTTTPVGKPETP